MEVVREVEDILHAYRTALEILPRVRQRISEDDEVLRVKADMLHLSLIKGSEIDHAHR